ncbi:MAG: electron transport complex subunit RnfE [Lysobacteraceae bacterium]|nr:MAG: electron transport complex subunit RnfE [Xanthomonadaceae bacterium]
MDRSTDPRHLAREGLWQRNLGLAQLLGLCPLLAVSHNATGALAMGLATLLALTASSVAVSALRRHIDRPLRLPGFLLLIAGIVTVIEQLMHAFLPALHAVLGLFLPLIVTNCALLARAESFASHRPVGAAFADGLFMGLGFLGVLLALGAIRELLGHGTLFADAGPLLGLPWLAIRLDGFRGLLIAALPPGAFLSLALLVAAHQWLSARPRRSPRTESAPCDERPTAP